MKKDTFECVWRKWAPYWHIGSAAVAAIGYCLLWLHNTTNAVAQVSANTAAITLIQQQQATMQEAVSDMKREVDAIFRTVVQHDR